MKNRCNECVHYTSHSNGVDGSSCPISCSHPSGDVNDAFHPIVKAIPVPKYELTPRYKDGISFVDICKENPCGTALVAITQIMRSDDIPATHKQPIDNIVKWQVFRDNINWLISQGFIRKVVPRLPWNKDRELRSRIGETWSLNEKKWVMEQALNKIPDRTAFYELIGTQTGRTGHAISCFFEKARV
ncbi:MAG: hypothetical protein GY861_04220 [bacterium]|nr:hypothetical protein [bacterium]